MLATLLRSLNLLGRFCADSLLGYSALGQPSREQESSVYRKTLRRSTGVLCALLAGALAPPVAAQDAKKQPPKQSYRGQLGPDNPKIRVEGGKTYLWYGQRRE